MLHLDLTLEDSRIIATRDDSGKWAGISADNLKGTQAPFAWSDEQIAAVVALAFGYGEENIDSPITAALYAIAEDACKGFPTECRPMP